MGRCKMLWTWQFLFQDTRFERIFQCSHEEDRDDSDVDYVEMGSAPHRFIENLVTRPDILAAVGKCSPSLKTSAVEAANSLCVKVYASKDDY